MRRPSRPRRPSPSEGAGGWRGALGAQSRAGPGPGGLRRDGGEGAVRGDVIESEGRGDVIESEGRVGGERKLCWDGVSRLDAASCFATMAYLVV